MDIPRILVITGPTATGKTALGVLAARAFGGEVVSADSMQVYRGMDIGTAKPTIAEMGGIPHHMLDVVSPDEMFSAARYMELAVKCVDGILSRGKLPVVVGGTGLYIDALIKNSSGFSPRDENLRAILEKRYESEGAQTLYAELQKSDPERAAKLSPSDKKRVLRALEVYELTGRTITEFDAETAALPPRYSADTWALNFSDRALLYSRIERRVDKMLAGGLIDEVRLLMETAPDDATSMQAIGYKELVLALRSLITFDEAAEAIKRESRRYAKRQLTWLRRRSDVRWIIWDREPELDDFNAALCMIRQYLLSNNC